MASLNDGSSHPSAELLPASSTSDAVCAVAMPSSRDPHTSLMTRSGSADAFASILGAIARGDDDALAAKARVLGRFMSAAGTGSREKSVRAAAEALIDAMADVLLAHDTSIETHAVVGAGAEVGAKAEATNRADDSPAEPLASAAQVRNDATHGPPAPDALTAFFRAVVAETLVLAHPAIMVPRALAAACDGLIASAFGTETAVLAHWASALRCGCSAVKSFTFYVHTSLPDASQWMPQLEASSTDARVRFVRFGTLSQPGAATTSTAAAPSSPAPSVAAGTAATDAELTFSEPPGAAPPSHVVCLVANLDDNAVDGLDVDKILDYGAFPARRLTGVHRTEVAVLLVGSNAALLFAEGRASASLRRLFAGGRVSFALPLGATLRHASRDRSADWALLTPPADTAAIDGGVPTALAVAHAPPPPPYTHRGAIHLSLRLTDERKLALHLWQADEHRRTLVEEGFQKTTTRDGKMLSFHVVRNDVFRVTMRAVWRAGIVAATIPAVAPLPKTASSAVQHAVAVAAPVTPGAAVPGLGVRKSLTGGIPLVVTENLPLLLSLLEEAAVALVGATAAVRLHVSPSQQQQKQQQQHAESGASVASLFSRDYFFRPVNDFVRMAPPLLPTPPERQSPSPSPPPLAGPSAASPVSRPMSFRDRAAAVSIGMASLSTVLDTLFTSALPSLGTLQASLRSAAPGSVVVDPTCFGCPAVCDATPLVVEVALLSQGSYKDQAAGTTGEVLEKLHCSAGVVSRFPAGVLAAVAATAAAVSPVRVVVPLAALRVAPARLFPLAAPLPPAMKWWDGTDVAVATELTSAAHATTAFDPSRRSEEAALRVGLGPTSPSATADGAEAGPAAGRVAPLIIKEAATLREEQAALRDIHRCFVAELALRLTAETHEATNVASATAPNRFAALAPFLWSVGPNSEAILVAIPLPPQVPPTKQLPTGGTAHLAPADAAPSQSWDSAVHPALLGALVKEASEAALAASPAAAKASEAILCLAIAHAERLLADGADAAVVSASLRFDMQSSKLKVRPAKP